VIIDTFVDARLLSSRREPEPDGDSVVEVAHQALLRQWTPLSDAIEASRSSIRMRSEVERATLDWIAHQRDDSGLLRGLRLAELSSWAELTTDLGTEERAFLAASNALAVREQAPFKTPGYF
jgi:hypothetical protein